MANYCQDSLFPSNFTCGVAVGSYCNIISQNESECICADGWSNDISLARFPDCWFHLQTNTVLEIILLIANLGAVIFCILSINGSKNQARKVVLTGLLAAIVSLSQGIARFIQYPFFYYHGFVIFILWLMVCTIAINLYITIISIVVPLWASAKRNPSIIIRFLYGSFTIFRLLEGATFIALSFFDDPNDISTYASFSATFLIFVLLLGTEIIIVFSVLINRSKAMIDVVEELESRTNSTSANSVNGLKEYIKKIKIIRYALMFARVIAGGYSFLVFTVGIVTKTIPFQFIIYFQVALLIPVICCVDVNFARQGKLMGTGTTTSSTSRSNNTSSGKFANKAEVSIAPNSTLN